jgi:hypothetical protein
MSLTIVCEHKLSLAYRINQSSLTLANNTNQTVSLRMRDYVWLGFG